MSFIITLYVQEGIVMASDSRITLDKKEEKEGKNVIHTAVGMSDSNYKTFLTPNNIGISTSGQAAIEGVPVAGYIESFIEEELPQNNYDVDKLPRKLLNHFKNFPGPPKIGFHVAGYKREGNKYKQHVWHVNVSDENVEQVNPPGLQGAHWSGVSDILSRLVNPVGQLNEKGELVKELPYYQIPFRFFTLQDAIDFAVYAVQVTIDSLRFQPRAKTVGGPVDVLVIKPEKAEWIQRKKLHP